MYIIHLIFYCLFNAISSSDYIASNGTINYTLVVKFQVFQELSLGRLASLQFKILTINHSNVQQECYLLDHI